MDDIASIPPFYDLLSTEDKDKFRLLRQTLASVKIPNKEMYFQKIFDYVRRFCIHHNFSDQIRFMVCGYCEFSGGFGINFSQFQHLIRITKFSLISVLNQVGYSVCQCNKNSFSVIADVLPRIALNHIELRKWHIFKDLKLSQVSPCITILPEEIKLFTISRQDKKVSTPQSIEDFFDDPFCLLPSFLVSNDGRSD